MTYYHWLGDRAKEFHGRDDWLRIEVDLPDGGVCKLWTSPEFVRSLAPYCFRVVG